ncbi:MAG: Sec-independent protein translocase protein TatB [Gammaproteobacteria bacterium]|nr:Sec-independent protein translocase protein TatB [Gammaproteobacteria bacterium]
MFDIGFPELILIAVVGLLVIGPERLPEALRTLGLWLGRMRRSFVSVKNEIEKEIGMDEVRRQLHNEAVMDEMKRIEGEMRDTVDEAAATSKPGNAATTTESTNTDDRPADPDSAAAAAQEVEPSTSPNPQP